MRISNPKDMGGNKLLHRVNVATGGVIQGEGTETSPLTANVEAIASNVFPTFSGNSGKVLRVNADATALEWAEMTSTSGKVETVRYVSSVEDYEAICALASSAGSGGVVPFVALNDLDLESDDVFDQGTETVSSSLKRGHTYVRIDAEFTIYFPSESGGTTHTRTVHTTTYFIHKFWLVNNSTGSHVDNWALYAWRDGVSLFYGHPIASEAGFESGYGWKNRTEVYDYMHWLMNGMWPTAEVHERPEAQEASLMYMLEVDGTYLGTNPDMLTGVGTNGATLKRISGVWRKGTISRDSNMNLVEYFDMDTAYSIQFMYRTSSGSSSTTATPMSSYDVTETWKTGAFEIPEKLIHLPLQLTGDITPGLPRKAEEVAYAAALEVHPGDCLSVSLAGNMTISALGGVDGVRQTASIDIMPGTHSVTAGQNLAIIGSLTVDKLNHCEIRWWGKEATLHALYAEDATSGGSSSSSSSESSSDSGESQEYVYTVTGVTNPYEAANGDYYATGEIKNNYPVYTNGTYVMYYHPTDWQGWTIGENTSGGPGIYKAGSTDPIGNWNNGVVVSAYSGSSSSSSGTTEGAITTSSQTIAGTAGTSLSYNLADYVTVSNGQTPTFTPASGQVLPTGLSLSSNGVISGTPEASSSTTIRVKVSASNCPDVEMTVTFNIAEAIQQGTITVTTNPTIQGVVGTAITSYNLASCVTVSNGQKPTFTVKSGNTLPAGIKLSSAGVLSGTPTVTSSATVVVTITARGCPDKEVSITFNITEAQAGSDDFPVSFTVTESQGLNGQGCLGTYTRTGNTLALDGVNYPVYSFTNASGKVHYIHISKWVYEGGEVLGTSWILDTRTSFTAESSIRVQEVYGTSRLKAGTYEPSSTYWNGDMGAVVVSWEMGGSSSSSESSSSSSGSEEPAPSDGWPTKIVVSNASSTQGSDVSAFNGDYVRTGETLSVLGENVPIWSNGSKYIYGVAIDAGMPATEPLIALFDSTGNNDTLRCYYYRKKSEASTSWKKGDGNSIGLTATITEVSGGESSSSSSGSEEPAPSDGWPTTITVSDATATVADSSWSGEWNGTYTRTGDTTTALGETIPVWSNGKYYVMGYGTHFESALSEVGIGFFTSKNYPDRKSSYYYRAKSATTWTRGEEAGGPGLTMTITEDYTSGGESGGSSSSSSSEAGGGVTYTMSRTSGSDSHVANAIGTYSLKSGTDGNTDAVYVNKNGWRIYYNTSNSRWALGESVGDEQFICSTLEGTYTCWDYECNDVIALKKDGKEEQLITFPESFSVTSCPASLGATYASFTRTSNTTTVNGTNYPVYSMTNPSPMWGTYNIYVCQHKQGSTGVFWALNNRDTYSATDDGYNALGALGCVAAGSDGLPTSTTWTSTNGTATVSWT